MKNPHTGHLPILAFFSLLIFSISCNAPTSPDASSQPARSDSSIVNGQEPQALVGPLANTFVNQLWIESTYFTNLKGADKKKLTFRFVIDSHALTLAAWSNDSSASEYPGAEQNPAFTLKLGALSGTNIGQGTNLGNLVLTKEQLKDINKSLNKSKDGFVVFTPIFTTSDVNQLTYEVSSSKVQPSVTMLVDKATLTAITTTNPSPPKNSN